MALNPDDLLLVNRSGTNFKIEYGLLKQNIINGIGGAIVSEDEPDGRHEGDLWYQPSTDSLFVWVVSDTTGVVTSVSVRNGGSGYTTNETNVATIGGDGEGLTIDIQAGVGGNYASPTVNQGGSGYAVSNVVFLTGAGNQNGSATVTAVNTVATGAWEAVGAGEGGGSSVSVGDNAPADPAQGDLWFNTDDGRLYVWYVDENTSQWVDASPAGGGEGGGGDTIINYNGASAWGVYRDGTLQTNLNIASATRVLEGVYEFTFTNPMPSAEYSVVAGSENRICGVVQGTQTANGFRILTAVGTVGQDIYATANLSFVVHSSNATPPRGGTGADAWGVITGAGVEQATFNSSVARTDVGRYQVTFTNPMPSANYSVVGSASPVSTVSVGSRTVNGFLLSVTDGFGAFVDVADAVHYVVHATNAQLPDTVTQEQLDAVLDNWTRTGTTLSPTNAGDSVGSSGGLQTTGDSWAITSGGQIDSWGTAGYALTVADTSGGSPVAKAVINRDGSATFQGILDVKNEIYGEGVYNNTPGRAVLSKTNNANISAIALTVYNQDTADYPFIVRGTGIIEAPNVTFGLTPEQRTTYGLQELDVKEKVLNFITRINQLEALGVNLANRLGAVESNEIIDDATDTALLQLLANASSRLDSIEARLTALEGN